MIVKSIILAVSKNGNFVILSVMIGKRETCEIVLISQEMKSKKGGSHEKKNFMYAAECSNAAYEFAGCFCGGDAAADCHPKRPSVPCSAVSV